MLKDEQQQQEQKEYFHPKITLNKSYERAKTPTNVVNRLYDKNLIKQNRIRKQNFKEQQQLKEKEEALKYPYQPKINSSYFLNKSNSTVDLSQFGNPNGFESSVQRMKDGYKKKLEKKKLLEHIPRGENYEKQLLSKKVKPFSFVSKQKNPRQILFKVEIKANNEIRKLFLYKNDNPSQIVRVFAMKYGLSPNEESKLEKIITKEYQRRLQQLENY